MMENKLDTVDINADEITRLIDVPYRHEKINYEVVSGLLVFLTIIANGVRVWFQI